MPSRRTLFFLSIVIMSFVLMTYQSKKNLRVSESFLSRILNASFHTEKTVEEFLKAPFRKIAIREEDNIRLKKKVDELLIEKSRYHEALLENQRLKDLLELNNKTPNTVASARVIARGVDRWAHVFLLDKGAAEGIVKDMTAITSKGLAGKILSSSDSTSSLLLVTDVSFSAAVRFQENRFEGVLSGTGTRKCLLKYVPYEVEVKTGDILVTSGLDAIFRPGIPVGYVSFVDKSGKGGALQSIEVIPFQDNAKLEEVTVIR